MLFGKVTLSVRILVRLGLDFLNGFVYFFIRLCLFGLGKGLSLSSIFWYFLLVATCAKA